MAGPAASYAAIVRAVDDLVAEHAENDRCAAAYKVARAALLIVNTERGHERAAGMAYQLADEFAVGGRR